MKNKPEKQEIREDIKKYTEIEAVANMEGGKTIIKALKGDILSTIGVLTSSYDTMTHTELIANCARLRERLSVYNTFMSASKNAKYAQIALENILKVDPDID